MHFKFCPDCGTKLASRQLGDEGDVPWCDICNKPWFDVFPACIIALAYTKSARVLVLRQNYISTTYANLVSGYITPGESAEQTAVREIKEETGLDVIKLAPAGTWWFNKKGLLMIGFFALVDNSQPLNLSPEVDSAEWVDPSHALKLVHPNGSVSHAICSAFLNNSQIKF